MTRSGALTLGARVTKVMSMQEAVRQFVRNGETVYAAGLTHAIPFAAVHEIIRQGKRDLVLCRTAIDLGIEQAIAAGCVRKVTFSWAGNPNVGLLQHFRRVVEGGRLEIEEYTHFGMCARLLAGATKLPFFPLHTFTGSDLARLNPNIRTIACPYTGVQLATVPALNPDVALVHAQRADAEGNTQLWGIVADAREAAFAARKVIVSVEDIVDEQVIRSDPNRTVIPGFLVSAVVREPWGAHPSYMQGFYDRDNDFYLEWQTISATEDALQAYLEEWVYGVANRQEYLQKLEPARIAALAPRPWASTSVDYGLYL